MLKKIMYSILAIILLIILTASFALYLKSPGKPLAVKDSAGNPASSGISVIEKTEIGGLVQYLIIRGNDIRKPVLLFLHGGPGSPEIAFMNHYNRALEEDFIMVYWEQRGSGKSFSSEIPDESMNMEQFIADTRQVSLYLANRFNQPKIYLMGHSWGSLLGIMTAWHYPELYHAYMGVGQVAHQYRGEKISFDWVMEQARLREDEASLKKLEKLTFPDSLATADEWVSYLRTERNFVNKFGGAMREHTSMWPLIKMVLNTPEYTFSEKFNYMRGNLYSLKSLWPEVIDTNLMNRTDSMQVPVFIFQGIHDYQTPYVVAKDFYDQLNAPQKDFFTFENSAHSPLMEEPERFNAILKQIVNKTHTEEVPSF